MTLEDQYYRIGQTAKYLGVSIQTIKMSLKNQKIQSIRTLGGEHRFSRSEINRILGQKTPIPKKTILYSRVSSHDQIHDLESQLLPPFWAKFMACAAIRPKN